MTRLRHLAVFVEEVAPGEFRWAIHEKIDETTIRCAIDSGVVSYPMWVDAYDAGFVELMKQVDDERIGPRAPREDEDGGSVGLTWPRPLEPSRDRYWGGF
ncbi:MAG: hypothetical protein JWQ73_3048 [Variovorax sp.]|nr:hypothetical protein [Variovorax sp.]